MAEPSNRALVDDFIRLLTDGVHGPAHIPPDEFLAITKSWRADLWRALGPIADRLCPLDALAREKAKADENQNKAS